MTHLESSLQQLFKDRGQLMIKRICYILLFGLLIAGTDGTIRGKVISSNDGQPLAGVLVFIAKEQIG